MEYPPIRTNNIMKNKALMNLNNAKNINTKIKNIINKTPDQNKKGDLFRMCLITSFGVNFFIFTSLILVTLGQHYLTSTN